MITNANTPPLKCASEAGALRNVFVCGCGHSGTSLLTAMLGAHKDIYSITEETRLFVKPDISDSDIQSTFATKFAAAARGKGARYICEKTPMHIHALARMRSLFPGARIVIPVRDPRDVALSIKLRVGRLKDGYDRWMRDNTVVYEQMQNRAEDAFIFRYEDFIANVEETLRMICAHIGVPYDSAMLDYHKDPGPWFGALSVPSQEPNAVEHVKLRNWQIKQPIMDRRGRWRGQLAASEVAEVENACATLMGVFNYT